MKTIKLSLAAITIASMYTLANADSFAEAMQGGKVTGDVTVTYEMRDQKKELNSYYDNSASAVGSVELIYKTGKFYNFSLVYGMRGYHSLWEDNKNDSSERFYGLNGGSLAETSFAYLAYDTDKVHAKIGRQELNTEWMDEHHDGVSIYATPMEKLELELIWSKEHNRIWSRELFIGNNDINKVKKNAGLYKVGVTLKPTDCLKVKGYALNAPDYYSIYGGKVTLDKKVGGISIGGFAHYMQTDEEVAGKDDGEMIDVKAYVGIAGYTAGLGYIATGKDAGWGSAATGGENVDPFEEGDQIYAIDSRTTYVTLSKSVGDLSISAIYGITDYRNTKGGKEFSKSELCAWIGYSFTKELNLSLIPTFNFADDDDATQTDMFQFSSTLTYKF